MANPTIASAVVELDQVQTGASFSALSGIVTTAIGKIQHVTIKLNESATRAEFSKIGQIINDEINKIKSSVNAFGNITINGLDINSSIKTMASELTSIKGLVDQIAQSAGKASSKGSGAMKNLVAGTKEYETRLTRLVALQDKANAALKNFSAAQYGPGSSAAYNQIQALDGEILQLMADMQSGNLTARDFDTRFTQLSRTLATNKAAIEQNNMAFKSLGNMLSGVPQALLQYFSAAKLVAETVKFIKEAVSASIELDSSFTQLKIVTGATDAEMSRFKDTAVSLAKELGQSVSDVAASIETFSRLGYTLGEASDLSKFAMILSNVADVSQEDATKGLTSIIKGYSMSVSDAEHIADVLVEVGQKYAVSASEMMEAYEKTGAALNATNTSFEKSAGLIAAANASVQNASVVGTALKTVSARIRKSETDASELGEDISDLADGWSKYREEIKSLTGFDIMVEGTKDTFKDLYDIFEGLSKVWDKLSDTQQARIAEIIGGTKQLQVISSVINNWKDAAGAYADAMNSAGAALKANDIYMDSVQPHIKQLKSTFKEFSMDLMSADILTLFVDFGRYILEAADGVVKLTNKIGGLKTVILATSAVLAVIKADNIFGALKTGIDMIKNIPATIKNITSSITSSITAANIGMAGIIAMAAGIALYVKTLKDSSFENRYKKVEDLNQELNNMQKTLGQNESRIAEIDALKGSSDWTPILENEKNELMAENGELGAQIALLQEKISLQQAAAKDSFGSEFNDYLGVGNSSGLFLEGINNLANKLSGGTYGAMSTDYIINAYQKAVEKDNKQDIARYYSLLADRRATLMNGLEFYDPEKDADSYNSLINTLNTVNKVLGLTGKTAESTGDAISQLTKYGDGGNVDLLNRPAISTSELSAAGWKDVGDGIATVFSSTYSNADQSLAMNFTPIIVDPETGKAKGVMTPEALESYAEDVINGVHDDVLNLQIGAAFEGENAIADASKVAAAIHEYHEELYDGLDAEVIEGLPIYDLVGSASRKAQQSLAKLWNSEEFAASKKDLIEMANTIDGISPDAIEALVEKSSELKDVVDETGISTRLLAGYFTREALTGDGVSLLTEDILGVDAALQMAEKRCDGATAALKRFSEATAIDNADIAKSYTQAYKQFLDDWESGRTGSNTVRAAANLFFSESQLAEMGWDLQVAGEKLSSQFFQAIFSTEGDPGANFARYVRDNYNDAWKEAIKVTENADGTFDIAVSSAKKLADAMGYDVDVANAFIEAMGAWGVNIFKTGEEIDELANSLHIVGDEATNLEKVNSAIEQLAEQHLSGDQIKSELQGLADAGYINIDSSAVDDLDQKIADAIDKTNSLDGMNPTYNINSNVESEISNVQTLISLQIGDKEYTVIEHHKTVNDDDGVSASASGTRNAHGGATLVNELGPELISDHGRAYIANGGQPAIVNLSPGAIVLNANQTRRALGGGVLSGVIGAMAFGSKATFPGNSGGSYYSGGSSGSSTSSSDSSNNTTDTSKEESWFEKQYKYHKHLIEMDQELQEDFLEWLDDAYKRAYAEGVIDLDEYYDKAEEVYKGLQDLFKDYLDDVEHSIDLAERAGQNTSDIINIYQTLLDEINAELTKAYANGLDENDDYVQYLQDQWYTYYDKLKDARENATSNAKKNVDDLVQYRIKMLKQYIKNEVDSLKERLRNLKDFYDKQKKMLQDSADEEDYIDEQREKRKAVSDIQNQLSMLELDNSAWAQKRKVQLQEELEDAQKELNKFERDHAIEVASEQLDAAYEVQERAINARVDELEALADNPKYLYDQALKDVQNNSVALYEEMIEYNNKYGLISWLMRRVICVIINHTYMRELPKALYQSGWLRRQNVWCESRKNIGMAYGEILIAV